MVDISEYIYNDTEEKVQYKSKCLLGDDGSPMEYKSGDGQLATNFYYVDPLVTCSDLMVDDLDFFEFLDDDEELSDEQNEVCIFHPIGSDNFV